MTVQDSFLRSGSGLFNLLLNYGVMFCEKPVAMIFALNWRFYRLEKFRSLTVKRRVPIMQLP